jgi:Tfp pilus assembly protein PilX
MLNAVRASACRRRDQQGIVLLIALIMLVAMTLTGIALIRSVYTANIIAGNLAFQQSATHSADAGLETAIAWLEANKDGTALHNNVTQSTANPVAYSASRGRDPGRSESWDAFWNAEYVPAGVVNTLAADASGNTVSYVIHRLCNQVGPPTSGAGCANAPATVGASGNSKGAGVVALQYNGQVYYRVIVRVSGARGTVSFVQSVVAM